MLQEDDGEGTLLGNPYFPNSDGTFSNLPPYAVLRVDGTRVPSSSGRGSSLTLSSTPASSSSSLPAFRSVVAKKTNSFSLKIVRANMHRRPSGKPDFQALSQTHVELVEATANLEYIMTIVERKWPDHIIVTSDGLALDDSPSTQGWCS